MRLRHIAYGNLRRRSGKAVLIVMGLTVAVSAFVLVLSLVFSLRETLDERLTRYGSNLVVTPQDPTLSLSYGGLDLGGAGSGSVRVLDEEDLASVRGVPSADRMAAAIPVRLAALDFSAASGSQGRFLAVGTDVDAALEVKPWWRVEGAVPAGVDEVLLGLNVRNALGVEPGDVVRTGGRDLVVSGVLWETGGEEDGSVFLARETLDEVAGNPGQIHLIEVTAGAGGAVDVLRDEISDVLPAAEVRSLRQSIEFTNQANEALAGFGLAVSGLVAVIAGFVVLVTLLTAVKERQREIGVFRAVGYKQRHVATLVLLEVLGLSLLAGVMGVGVGFAGVALVPRLVDGLTLSFVVDPRAMLIGVTVGLLVGVGAALYPAWRAANLDPASALRYI